MNRRARTATLIAALALLCGPHVSAADQDEQRRLARSLSSIAHESVLLLDQLRREHLTPSYTGIHSRKLEQQLDDVLQQSMPADLRQAAGRLRRGLHALAGGDSSARVRLQSAAEDMLRTTAAAPDSP